MARRKSKLEIYLDVLWVTSSGINEPGGIMNRTNLSWELLQKILSSMLSQGLITETESSSGSGDKMMRIYRITEKGESIIKYFSRSKELLPPSINRFLTQGDYSSLSSFDITLDLSYLALLSQKS